MDNYTEQLFENSNTITDKINMLSAKKEDKVNRLAGTYKGTSVGITDGDTMPVQLEDGSKLKLRESNLNGAWYDTNEVAHEGATGLTKSSNSLVEHRNQAARLLGKPVESVTQQDLFDVGNMQTIQRVADSYRSKGEPRWEAPLIPNSVRPNLDVVAAPVEVKLSGKKDAYGRDLGELYNPSTGINLTQEATNDPRMNVFYDRRDRSSSLSGTPKYDDIKVLDLSGDTEYLSGTAVQSNNTLRGFGARVLDVGAKLGSLLGEGIESVGEGEENYLKKEQEFLDKHYTGEKVSDWRKAVANTVKDAGTDIQKSMTEFQRKNRANEITGYDNSDVTSLQNDIDTTIKNDGYVAAIARAVTDPRSLEALVQSTPEMIALAASTGTMAIANANNNINIGEAEAKRPFTSDEKAMSVVTSIVSTYLDRAGDKLALSGMNGAKQALKTAVDAAPDGVKDVLGKTFGAGVLKIGEAPLRLLGSGAVEGGTEYLQTLGETAAQRPEVFREGFTDKQLDEAGVAGVLGAAMGTHMATPSVAAGVVNGASGTVGDVVENLQEKAGLRAPVGIAAKKEVYNSTDYSGIADEDRASKVKDVIDYATLMIVDPEEAKANGYEKGRVNLEDVVSKVAAINGIAAENTKYIYKDVLDGIKRTLSRNSKADNSTKMEVFKGLLEDTGDNKEATGAINNAVEDIVADELSDVSAKVSEALGKSIDLSELKITEDEMVKINNVIAQMKEMGSEDLTKKALAIEDVIKGLGKKKTYTEVRDDIKKAGFLFFGKSYKSLDAHEKDIERELALGSGVSEAEKLAEFVKSRSSQRVRFDEEVNGVIKDRDISVLRSFVEINNEDNKEILKTIDKLLSKIPEDSDSRTILENSKKELESTINKYDSLRQAKNVTEFRSMYESDEVSSDIEESGKNEPVVEREDVTKKQNEFVDKIINKASNVDEALSVFNTVKNIHKLEQSVRSRLESRIREADKFKEKAQEKKEEVVDKKVQDKKPREIKEETKRIAEPLQSVQETMTELEYYTKAEQWSKEANKIAKDNLQTTNEKLRDIYRELDNIKVEKEIAKEGINKLKDDIRSISVMIRKTNAKIDTMETSGWKAVAEVMNGIKRLVKDTYKVLYRLLKAKAIKEYKVDSLFSRLKALENNKKELLKELKALKEVRDNQRDRLIEEAQELKEVKAKLAEAQKELFSTTYGEDSAKVFKKVNSDKVTVTNKFSDEIFEIEVSQKAIGGGAKKKEVITNNIKNIADKLVELMPKSVIKILSKKPEYINKAVKTYMDYRYGDSKKISIPKQEGVLKFLNNWLDVPELNSKLHTALDVAGLVMMDDMLNVRTLNSSMLEDMIDGAFGVKAEDPAFKGIKRDIQQGKYVPMSSFVKSAGSKVVSELGLKFDDNQLSIQDRQDIEFALGQMVVERAKLQINEEVVPTTIGISASSITLEENNGEIIGYKIADKFEEGKDTTRTKRIVLLSELKNRTGLRELVNVLEYAGEKSDGELLFEPTVIKEGAKVRNSNVNMSKDAIDYINHNNSIPWKFTDELKEIVVKAKEVASKNGTSVNEVMYELLLEDVHGDTVSNIESELAKREAEKLEIDRMLLGYELAGSDEFYLNWDQTISGRYMIANKMINPQNSKIVRFLVQTDDMKSKLVRGANGYNGKDIAIIKGAIAQAFGYGIDKDTDANVFSKMSKELVNINDNGSNIRYPNGSKLKEAVDAYKDLDIVKTIRVLKEMGVETNERMHTLQALKVLAGLERQQPTISHGLVVEVDAITNGMILTLLEIGSEWAMDMLAKGGIYWGANKDKYSNHGEFKQDGGVDIYQTPVEGLVKRLDTESVIGNMLDSLLSKNGEPDMNKWRSALKPLVMVYIYGAGIGSITRKAGTEFGNLLMESFIKHGDYSKLNMLLEEVGIDTDNLQFADKKRLLKGELRLTNGKLSKANMDSIRLTPYQEYQLSNAITEVVSGAIEESFEESFEEISEYRKVLKTIETLNYMVFKQELDKVVKDRDEISIADLNRVLSGMQKDGTYYGANNSSGSIQDYVKLGTEGSKEVNVTGFFGKSASGKTGKITVNSALKWFKSNIGAVGVTAIHDKDGRVMAESDIDGTLNIYDAKVIPASYKVANENTTRMNQAIIDVSRNHSIIAEATEKLERLLDKLDSSKISKELSKEVINDLNRVFGEGSWISGIGLAEKLKEIRDNRTKNVSTEMTVNHVYALDSLSGIEAKEGDVRTIELTDKEIESIAKKLDAVIKTISNNEVVRETERDISRELKKQGMSQENKSIIDKELEKADTNLLSVIRQLVEGCK